MRSVSMNNISKKIEERIQELNISQRELAEKVCVTEATISRYINGERIPRGDIIPKIAKSLKVTADYLVNGDNNTNKNSQDIDYAFADALCNECKKKNIDLKKLSLAQKKKLAKRIATIISAFDD
ncbi:TPA: helix-turn-helix domain-containing protein [Clostridium botulinum]|uniref:Helix-turn-helix domain protein n=2 Tax=Clostridium botulinum TaxID=1491 RepID=A0A140C2Z8_CLOBO|nr:helix-turn-helix domain protein [Clostridium botulinum]ALT05760.1 helix-turn-helix domain protein [Clostridium botulinum]ALT05862.1 helix-turn-helix domain protein [Clostridium botulinum]MBN1050359.1 helix-turn-helix domain-containing protein [Clostridium botulinum]HBJ2623041.1 helix-turn-helix domain-containing protein [Clostridium botulinum]